MEITANIWWVGWWGAWRWCKPSAIQALSRSHQLTWDENGLDSVDGQPPLTSLLIAEPIIPCDRIVFRKDTWGKFNLVGYSDPPGSWRMEMQTLPSLSMLGCHISVRILHVYKCLQMFHHTNSVHWNFVFACNTKVCQYCIFWFPCQLVTWVLGVWGGTLLGRGGGT